MATKYETTIQKNKEEGISRRRKKIEDSVSFLKGESSANPSSNLYSRFGYVDAVGSTITDKRITFVKANQEFQIHFPGFLTSYSDSFRQNVNKEKVFGRSDPLHTYENTERSISFAWVAPSASPEEAQYNLFLINSLVQAMYPDYRPNKSGGNTITTSALMGISFHGLAHGNLSAKAKSGAAGKTGQFLYGYIESLTIDHDFEAGVFEELSPDNEDSQEGKKASSSATSAIEKRETGAKPVAAKAIRLNVTFSPIHPETLGWQGGEFISNDQFPYQGASTAFEKVEKFLSPSGEGPYSVYDFTVDPKKKALYDAYQAQLRAQEQAILNPQNPWERVGDQIAGGYNATVDFFDSMVTTEGEDPDTGL